MKRIILSSTDPSENLGLERSLLRERGDFFLLWRSSPSVIIGKNQLPENEVNLDFTEKNGIKVVRRITGGGAVFHDLGNVNFSFILNGYHSFEDVCLPIMNALSLLGVNCVLSGRNDIMANGKKISGNARYLHTVTKKDRSDSSRLIGTSEAKPIDDDVRILHHGTLLFDCDLKMMEAALKNGGKRNGRVASVKGNVGNIRPMLDFNMTTEEFIEFMFENTNAADNLPQDVPRF